MYRPSFVYRFQSVLLLTSVMLGVIGFLVFEPLSRRAHALDKAVSELWQTLVDINLNNKAKLGLDSASMRQSKRQEEKALADLQQVYQQIRDRIAFDPEIREKLKQPFELWDFAQVRLQMITDLRSLAGSKKVALEPAVVAGFPEFSVGREKPSLLWAQLAILNSLLTTAVAASPATIKSVNLLSSQSHLSADRSRVVFEEFPVQIEVAGSMESVLNLLASLPLKSDELKSFNLPEAPPTKPALFLNQFILKSVPGNPNDTYLEALVSGFLANELSP